MGSLRACALSALWSAHADSAATARSARRHLECGGGDPGIWPRDVFGDVRGVRRQGNGRVLVELHVGDSDTRARIVDLDPSTARHPALDSIATGTFEDVFNLGRAQGPSSFLEGPITTIYSFESAF